MAGVYVTWSSNFSPLKNKEKRRTFVLLSVENAYFKVSLAIKMRFDVIWCEKYELLFQIMCAVDVHDL